MSSSIVIPAIRNLAPSLSEEQTPLQASSSSGSSYDGSPRQPHRAQGSPSPSPNQKPTHERRPSAEIPKQECAFINIGDPEGPPRLILFLESSRGFVWNPEIFLPSYLDCDYTPLENRREPVHEIRLTDEEINTMFPQ